MTFPLLIGLSRAMLSAAVFSAEVSFAHLSDGCKPNLLVIVDTDTGFGDLQCNGAAVTTTPALDSLAYDGIRFTQFTTTGGGAHAAQFALLTGRVAARSGMGGSPPAPGSTGWRGGERTLGEMLRDEGYHAAFIGEWLLGDAEGSHPNDQGYAIRAFPRPALRGGHEPAAGGKPHRALHHGGSRGNPRPAHQTGGRSSG